MTSRSPVRELALALTPILLTLAACGGSGGSGDGSATLMFYEDNFKYAGSSKDIYELVDILFPRSTPPRVIMNLAVDGGVSIVDTVELWKTNFLFNAYITSASVAVSYGEVVTVDTSFTVDGPLLDVPYKPDVVRL